MKDLFTNHQYGVRASFILVCKSLALLIYFMICLLFERQCFIYRSSHHILSYWLVIVIGCKLSSVPWKCQKKCNGQNMRLNWILVRICLNFHFLASKWHLIASKYPKFAVPWKWRFSAKPFFSKQSHAFFLTLSRNTTEFALYAIL